MTLPYNAPVGSRDDLAAIEAASAACVQREHSYPRLGTAGEIWRLLGKKCAIFVVSDTRSGRRSLGSPSTA